MRGTAPQGLLVHNVCLTPTLDACSASLSSVLHIDVLLHTGLAAVVPLHVTGLRPACAPATDDVLPAVYVYLLPPVSADQHTEVRGDPLLHGRWANVAQSGHSFLASRMLYLGVLACLSLTSSARFF